MIEEITRIEAEQKFKIYPDMELFLGKWSELDARGNPYPLSGQLQCGFETYVEVERGGDTYLWCMREQQASNDLEVYMSFVKRIVKEVYKLQKHAVVEGLNKVQGMTVYKIV